MNHLLKLLDLSKEEITDLLNLADQLKYETKHGIKNMPLKGMTLGMIFQKPLPAPVFPLKPVCTSWAATPSCSPPPICRLAGASRCRIQPGFSPGIWMPL